MPEVMFNPFDWHQKLERLRAEYRYLSSTSSRRKIGGSDRERIAAFVRLSEHIEARKALVKRRRAALDRP